MASQALNCTASATASAMGGNKNKGSQLSSARSVSFFPSSSPSLKSEPKQSNSMVVKAQDAQEHFYSPYSWLNYKPALIDSPPYVRAPWGHTVTDKEIMMSFDMPGVEAQELEVTILGDELNIMFKGAKDKMDALGRKITGLYDTKIQLPPNCVREKAEAEFRNGILYVRAPRMAVDRTVPIYVPVRAII